MVCLTALYGWQIHCPVLVGPDYLTWVLSVWTDRSTDQSTVLLGSDDNLTLLLLYMYMYGADRSTVPFCPDCPTWLLCVDWQIHCPSPLSWFVLIVSVTWLFCMGLWFNISAAQGCWGLELNKHTNHLHESSITWKLYIIQSHVHVNSVTEIQSCSEFQPLNSCAHPRIFFSW